MTQEAIGNTVLDIMENEDLQINASQVGYLLTDQLNRCDPWKKFPCFQKNQPKHFRFT